MAGILISLLPGFLMLQSLPATADAAAPAATAAFQGSLETPKQVFGSTTALPTLTSTEATRTSASLGTPKEDTEAPKNALPREEREGVRREARASSKPVSGGSAFMAQLAAEPPCGSVPAWRAGYEVAAYERAAYQQTIWEAMLGIPGYLNQKPPPDFYPGTYWKKIGPCPLPPAPTVTSMSPDNGVQLMTTTPTLSATATTWAGGTISFDFEVCESPSMSVCNTYEDCCRTSSGSRTVPDGVLAWGRQYWWRVKVSDASSIGGQSAYSRTQSFVVGVRQPTITSQLSTPGVNGQEFHQASGNYTTTFTDVQVPVAGPPLSVVRSYNSMDPRRDAAFGAGWSTRWDMRVVEETIRGLASVLVTYPDGRQVRFAKKPDGGYQPPPGMFATLAKNTDGSWRLMDKSSTSYAFDSSGRLLKVTDQRGRTQNLEYGSDGKLAKATAPGGRSLTFTWSGAHVETVTTDPVDGKPLTWVYTYNGDVLEKVCNPAQECTVYSHNPGSLYRSTVLDSDPMGYWRFGETTGRPAKDLGWIGNASYNNDIALSQPGALAGTPDTAVGIPASSTGAIGLPSGIIPRAGAWASIETWFKTGASGTIMTVQGDYSYINFPMLQVTADGKLAAGYDAASRIVTTAVVKNDAWHHAVLTAEGDRQTLYVDGVAVGTFSGAIRNTSSYYAQYMTLGGISATVDELAVYDRPLSSAEVARHYAARAEAPHKLTKITLPSGRIWAANTYDASTDRIKTHTDSNGGTWQLGDLTTDSTTGMSTVTVTDPNSNTLSSVHDSWRGYRLVSQTDQLGKKATYSYDTGGFLQTITDPNLNTVTTYNDARGNVLQRRTCRTSTCQLVRSEYYLNSNDPFDQRNDRVLKVRDARSASATDNTYATTFEYNQYGEQTKQTTPATSDFPNGRSATVAYTDGTEAAVGGGTTPAGLVSSQTDPRGNTWTYRYTAAGDLAEQRDPEGLLVKLSYDPLGRLREKSQVSQAHPDGVKTALTYDEVGRVATQTEPGVKNEVSGVTHTKRTTYAYDPDGNKLSETISDLTGGDAERSTVYTYDAHGRVETSTDPEGGVVRQNWNTIGSLATVTDARGAVIEYGYSKRGELASKTLKGWTGSPVNPQPAKDVVLESFSYDDGGRLAVQSDAMGRKTTFKYFNNNLLAQKTASAVKLNGSTTARDVVLEDHTYDDAGNQTKLVTGGGKVTTEYVYDAAARLTSQTLDPGDLGLNRKTVFTYDANNNTIKTARTGAGSARTEITEYAYNKTNLLTTTTVENGDVDLVSTVTYDDRGLAVASTDPRGNADGANKADFTTEMRYDALGRLVEATGPQVKVEKAGTAADAHPTVHFGYDTLGAKTHETDAEGRTVTSTFDKAGHLTDRRAPSYTPPGGTSVTPTASYAYDAAGQLISTTDPRGYTTTFDYDKLGRQVRVTDPAPDGQTAGTWVTEYDLAGEKLATLDPTGARSEATYDDLGRQITATQIERKPTSAAYTTTMEYDDAGRLVKQIAPGNKATSYTVNAAGEVKTVTDPLTNKTTMDYDLAGRLIKTIDPNRNATTAEYDLAGRKTAVKDLDSTGAVLRTFGYGYDAAGNQISATSPEGHVTKQTFDALSRTTSLIEPVSASEQITTSFGYDATGARTRLIDGRGNATWTTYNTLGLVETVTEPSTTAHPNPADRTWTQIYDKAGNQVATIQPGGVRIDRTFDHLGRLTKETGAGGGATTAERTFGYDLADRPTTAGDLTVDFNDRGLPLKVSRGTAQETAYGYDELGNPNQRIDAAGTSTFTWDKANRLETATDPVTGRTLTYGYDPASRLKTITATSGTASTQTIDYDNMDRITGQTLKNGSGTQLAQITYGWDKDDNLTTKTTVGLAGAGTNTYGYDHAGRLTSWTAPGGATTAYEWDAAGNRTKAGNATFTYDERNRLTSGDGTDYTYTARGTLATSTKAGATTQYTFDAFDRLIADGDSLYSYDALDRMTSRIRGTAKQTFAYAGLSNDLAAISDSSGAVQAKYARDASGGLLGLKEGTSAAVAALNDLHGDLVATFTTSLQISTAYDPFGTVTAQTGAKTLLGYQGEYTDPDTGKVNMHARWYQPSTGAFTSRDTATLNPSPSVQANRYTYANASPLTGTDPTGHYTIDSGSLGGVGYGGSGSSGYTTIPAGGYSSSKSSGGTCIGSCYGGGGVVEVCTACITAGEATWNFADDAMDWYFENYVLPSLPSFSNEEAQRIGVMTNGMTAPADYWEMSAKQRAAVTDFISWVNFMNPSITEEELLGIIRTESDSEMRGTFGSNTTSNTSGRKAAYRTKPYSGMGGPSGSNTASNAPSRQSIYDKYKAIAKYRGDIDKAAAHHGISRYVLAAVIMWESTHASEGLGVGAIEAIRREGWNASLGVGQLEAYKARWMLIKYYSNERDWTKATLRDVARQLFNAVRAIHLTAAWLKHLKQNIVVTDSDTGVTRHISDKEAAYAYCGCSGVVFRNKDGSVNYPVPKYDRFRVWVQSGYRYLNTTNAGNAIQRKKDLDAMLEPGTGEAWIFAR
ncbi:RHS repeat-associated core domain-containing protein [Nonomuraea sp. NPDC050786]|uniref:RHS repeat-associated core domain-containing protein n=1 Tax=Nonomuraea sp. NPDC050786 TaxID=3154840 RepID=UPI00340023AC